MSEFIRDLARRHAADGLSKKSRNAELRRLGIDPDGEDGRKYRQFFSAAKIGQFVAEHADELTARHGRPEAVVLWNLPREEHAAWLAAGCGEGTWNKYQRRLHAAVDAIEAAGYRVLVISPTVAEVMAALNEGGWANDPSGRAAALNVIATKKERNKHAD